MNEFLLELFSEEIPARMQENAASAMEQEFIKILNHESIAFEQVASFVTPRRIVIYIAGLPEKQPDIRMEKKGPKIEAPQVAIDGFKKSLEGQDAEIFQKEGLYYANISQKGRIVADIVKEIAENIIKNFTWPKSMRDGVHEIRWVRPLKNIMAILNSDIVPIEFGRLSANNLSYGHRFLNNSAFEVKDFDSYQRELLNRKVILSHQKRKMEIMANLEKEAAARNLVVKEDSALLTEVTGLVEMPVVMIGNIEQEFMYLPKEVLSTTMRSHQKYFSLNDLHGNIAPHFAFVSNMNYSTEIIHGNERVLRARLSDAKFFFEQDKKIPLAAYLPKLSSMIFHAKIGFMDKKARNIHELVKYLTDDQIAIEAARLAKADLVTGMVGEFPELQGIMGCYYADDKNVGIAIRDHYKPMGANDDLPTTKNGSLISIADKIDSLVGLFAIGEKPTGSKDPFALRRSAIGIIRLILDEKISLDITALIKKSLELHGLEADIMEVRQFIIDRMEHYLGDLNIRAISSKSNDILDIYNRLINIGEFTKTIAGKELIAAYKRASNIISKTQAGLVEERLFTQDEEKALFAALIKLKDNPRADYMDSLNSLSSLKTELDNFFDKVMVNHDDIAIKNNRLALMQLTKSIFDEIADFSKIELPVAM